MGQERMKELNRSATGATGGWRFGTGNGRPKERLQSPSTFPANQFLAMPFVCKARASWSSVPRQEPFPAPGAVTVAGERRRGAGAPQNGCAQAQDHTSARLCCSPSPSEEVCCQEQLVCMTGGRVIALPASHSELLRRLLHARAVGAELQSRAFPTCNTNGAAASLSVKREVMPAPLHNALLCSSNS